MKRNLIRVWKKNSLFKQTAIAAAVVICALLAVLAIDMLSHPGRSWNESIVVNMILMRRSGR